MPREITDRGRVVEAVQNLALTAELFEEQNGKQKHASDLEVIVQGRAQINHGVGGIFLEQAEIKSPG